MLSDFFEFPLYFLVFLMRTFVSAGSCEASVGDSQRLTLLLDFCSISDRSVSSGGTLLPWVSITALASLGAVKPTLGSKVPPLETLLPEMEKKSSGFFISDDGKRHSSLLLLNQGRKMPKAGKKNHILGDFFPRGRKKKNRENGEGIQYRRKEISLLNGWLGEYSFLQFGK